MADAELAKAMGTMRIEKRESSTQAAPVAEYHLLTFDYPSFSLLKPEEKAQFEVPAKVEHRTRPPQDCGELALYDTNFHLALPTTPAHTITAQPFGEWKRLINAIENLKQKTGGTTKVCVLRVHQEIWDETTLRIRLETTSPGPFPDVLPQVFQLEVAEWDMLVLSIGNLSWVKVLSHLIARASAKAYYHVRQRISARYGAEEADGEEESWNAKWGTKRDIWQDELFINRLTPNEENMSEGKMPEAILPCGHGFWLRGVDAWTVARTNPLNKTCQVCGARIMQPEDDAYLSAVIEKHVSSTFAKMQGVWADLVRDVHRPSELRKFCAMPIFHIIGAAVESLRSPESVAPATICPSRFEETALVLEHLESMFWDENNLVYERTAEQLLEDLESEALGVRVGNKTLGESANPPVWDDFLAKWLRRTAYFLAYRRCDDYAGKRCEGLHWHNNQMVGKVGLYYAPSVWEKIDDESAEKPADSSTMQDVMEALERMGI